MMKQVNVDRRSVIAAGGASLLIPHTAALARPSVAPKQPFVWGVAASAGQTESRQGRGRSNWDVFADTPGKIADGSTNARCTEFDLRYREDLDLLKAAGVPAFRFSIAWPRIQPDGPAVNQAGIDLYARIIDAMLQRGIDPWITLFHWDIPVWAGDFRQRDIAYRMADYAGIVVDKLGDRVRNWFAFNEPNVVAVLGYALGRHAPGVTSPVAMAAAIHHENLAIGLMIEATRSRARAGSQVGTTHSIAPVRAASESAADQHAAFRLDNLSNRAFLDPLFGKGYPAPFDTALAPFIKDGDLTTIAAKPDFIGLQYYSRIYVRADDSSPIGLKISASPAALPRVGQFVVEPDGLTEALTITSERYGRTPIYITEMGFSLDGEASFDARRKDARRTQYIDQYLAAAALAKSQGVDLRGLFYWAATDNWEWAEGNKHHFGLIAADQVTQRRGAKSSLAKFGNQLRRHFPTAARPRKVAL